MGQKVHPTGIRLGIVKKHASTWYSDKKDYADKLNQDFGSTFLLTRVSLLVTHLNSRYRRTNYGT
jgi:hypothetical protein